MARRPVPAHSLLVGAFAVLGGYLRIMLCSATPLGYTNYLTSQLTGSLIMGLVVPFKPSLATHWDPLVVGIATGFCGSLTTFSSWQVDAAQSVGFPGSPSSPGAKAYNWFSVEYVGLAVAISAVQFGLHMGRYFAAEVHIGSTPPPLPLDLVALFVALCTFLGVALNAGYNPDETSIGVCFAPFGAWLRYALALHYNKSTVFKWGTFWANMAGSFILGGIVLVQATISYSFLTCSLLNAAALGFCGSFTTVSTLVLELQDLSFANASRYFMLSLITSQLGLLLMFGIYVASLGPGVVFPSNTCLVPPTT